MDAGEEPRGGPEGAAAKQVYADFSLSITALTFTDVKRVPGLAPRPPLYRVHWKRGHNGEGVTAWKQPQKDAAGSWRVLWEEQARIPALHVPVRGAPGAPPPKQLLLELHMTRSPHDPAAVELVRCVSWALEYEPRDEQRRKTGSIAIRRQDGAEPFARLALSYSLHRLSRHSGAAERARAERRVLRASGATSPPQPPQPAPPPAPAPAPPPASAPAPLPAPAPEAPLPPAPAVLPPQPPLSAATGAPGPGAGEVGEQGEVGELKAAILRMHGELHRAAAAVRRKRAEVAELQERHRQLGDDFALLRREVQQQERNREALQLRLAHERRAEEASPRRQRSAGSPAPDSPPPAAPEGDSGCSVQ